MPEHVPEEVHAGADVAHGDVGDVENFLVDQVVTSPVMNTNNCNVTGNQSMLLCSLSILLEPLELIKCLQGVPINVRLFLDTKFLPSE